LHISAIVTEVKKILVYAKKANVRKETKSR